ncbi:unnamed protein product [Arabidopsis halleri]
MCEMLRHGVHLVYKLQTMCTPTLYNSTIVNKTVYKFGLHSAYSVHIRCTYIYVTYTYNLNIYCVYFNVYFRKGVQT